MKFIKEYKLFEDTAEQYKKKYDDVKNSILLGLIKDIRNKIKSFGVEQLQLNVSTDYNLTLKRPIIKQIKKGWEYVPDNKITMSDIYVDYIYVSKNSVHIAWIYDEEMDENLNDIDINDSIKILDYLENSINLDDMIEYFYNEEQYSNIADLIIGNIEKIDLDDIIDNKSIFDLYEDDEDEFKKVLETSYFQKWLCENNSDMIPWVIIQDVTINADIQKEFKQFRHLFNAKNIDLL